MKIVVVDGQGGRLGRILLDKLMAAGMGESVVCVGCSALATMAMLKQANNAMIEKSLLQFIKIVR